MEDWFLKLEQVRDRMMQADDLDLEPIYDEDDDELDSEEVVLIREFGFQNGGHWEAFRNWGSMGWSSQTGEPVADLMMRMSMMSREKIMQDKAAAMTSPGGGGALDPVEGVSLQDWAGLQAAIASGGDAFALVANAGIDKDRWDRVSAEWNARMATDTTATIATAYGNAFAGAGQGQFGAAAAAAAGAGPGGDPGAEPVPFERFVEIQEAVAAGYARGEDGNALLAQFGLTAADWGNLGMYWNKKMQAEMTRYHQLFTEYSAKYKAKYGGV